MLSQHANGTHEAGVLLRRIRKIVYSAYGIAFTPIAAFCGFGIGALMAHSDAARWILLVLMFLSFALIPLGGTMGDRMRDLRRHGPLGDRLLKSDDPAYIPVLIAAWGEVGSRLEISDALIRHFDAAHSLSTEGISRWEERKLLRIVARRYGRSRFISLPAEDMAFTGAAIRFLARVGSSLTWKQFHKIANRSPSSSGQKRIYYEIQAQLQKEPLEHNRLKT